MRGLCASCLDKDAVLVEGEICYPCYEKYRNQANDIIWEGVVDNET